MNSIYNIWFARVPVANSIKKKLCKKFSVKKIFEMTEEEFLENGLKLVSAEKFLNKQYRKNLEKYQDYMNKNSIKLIFYSDKEYPNRLKRIADSPTYIFAKRKYKIVR